MPSARPTSAIRGLATAAVWLLASCSTAAKSPDAADIASADTPSADTSPADTSTADTSTADTSTDASPTAFDPCAVDVALAFPPTPADRTTPRWAFEPWISKDISTADDTRAFVKGFKDRGIPVGVVVIDSPWETNYHTFEANPKRYPGFYGLVDELHAQQVRVVMWMTSQVNDQSYDVETGGDVYDGPSPNFAEGLACGHYVNGGYTAPWWKGFGAGIDFFSPAARTWWNRQQLSLLSKIDGYKLDFGEMYLTPQPMQTAQGLQSLDAYSQAYYREMLRFGRSRNPEFLTMVRPWDESYDFAGRFFAHPDDAPVAWVGDNRRDWVGFVDALDHIFRSAAAGYTMVGSDIGGYLDRNDKRLIEKIPFDPVVFARWIAVGALGPFMQLHGRANLTPWTMPERGDELLAAYAYWSHWHHQFAPMLYSVTWRSQTQAGQPLVLQPLGNLPQWPGDWRYLLGDRWLVAPLVDASGQRKVALPAGRSWLDWWQLDAAPLAGGVTVEVDLASDLTKTPLYLDACSLQPFVDGNPLTGLAPAGLPPHDGWLVAAAVDGERSFVSQGPQVVQAALQVQGAAPGKAGQVSLQLSARPRPVVLAIRTGAVQGVSLDGSPVAQVQALGGAKPGWQPASKPGLVWVYLPAGGAASLAVQ